MELLFNCIMYNVYCAEGARNEYKYPTMLYSWLFVQLVIVQYRALTHPVTLVVFFQVTEKG